MSHNALSTVNGYANTALFTAPAANDAVAYCQSLGEGWYLPARDELWELFDVYNGIGHADPDFASVVPDKLTEVEKAARAAFDKMLTDLQGDVINEAAGSGNGKAIGRVRKMQQGIRLIGYVSESLVLMQEIKQLPTVL